MAARAHGLRLLAGLLFLWPAAEAQVMHTRLVDRYAVRQWGREQDFPDVRIRNLAFDDDSMLWLVTPRELMRFDGVNLNAATNLPPSLSAVRGWARDKDGTTWLYGPEGLAARMDAGWKLVAAAEPMEIQDVLVGADGLWVVGAHHLWRYQKNQLKRMDWPADMTVAGAPPRVVSASLDADQTLWLVADGKLRACRQGQWLSHQTMGIPVWSDVSLVRVEERGSLLVVADHGLHIRRRGTSAWIRALFPVIKKDEDPLPWQPTALLEESPNGDVWVGTRGALHRWSGRSWQSLGPEDVGARLSVNTMRRDRFGDIWVGTENGLLCLHRRSVTMLRGVHAGRPEPIAAVFPVGGGHIGVGVVGRGLWTIEKDVLTPMSIALPSQITISAMLPATGGGWWVGTKGAGLFWMTSNRFVRARLASPEQNTPKNISGLHRDRLGRLWVGAWEGLFRMPEVAPDSDDAMILRAVDLRAPAGSPPVNVAALVEDAEGTIWISSGGRELIRISNNDVVQRLGTAEGLPGIAILCLHVDREQRLWAGCAGGLIRWDGNRWRPCDMRKDLVVRQLFHDSRGRLWLGTPQGLLGLRTDAIKDLLAGQSPDGRYFRLGVADGMTSVECMPDLSQPVAADKNHIYFATVNGLASVPIEVVQVGRRPSAIYVERVTAADATLWDCRGRTPGEAALPARPIRIMPGNQPLRIEAALPELFWRDRVRYDYQWKLEGWHRDWLTSSADSVMEFDYLPPGDYRLHIRGRRESQWCAIARPVILHVLPHFWQRAEFQMIVAGSALGFAALATWRIQRSRYRRRLRLAEQARLLAQERTRIAQDLHDEMGAGLTEIGLLGDLASTDTDAVAREENIGLLTQRARMLIAKLDEIVWAISPRHDHLDALIAFFCNYAQQFLRPAGIVCVLDVAENLPDLPLASPARHQLLMAFKEALTNLVRHSGATQAHLHISVEADVLSIRVRDNGGGLPSESTDEPRHGVEGMRSRLEKIGGVCEVQSPPAGGVSVVFRLPLKKGKRA